MVQWAYCTQPFLEVNWKVKFGVYIYEKQKTERFSGRAELNLNTALMEMFSIVLDSS